MSFLKELRAISPKEEEEEESRPSSFLAELRTIIPEVEKQVETSERRLTYGEIRRLKADEEGRPTARGGGMTAMDDRYGDPDREKSDRNFLSRAFVRGFYKYIPGTYYGLKAWAGSAIGDNEMRDKAFEKYQDYMQKVDYYRSDIQGDFFDVAGDIFTEGKFLQFGQWSLEAIMELLPQTAATMAAALTIAKGAPVVVPAGVFGGVGLAGKNKVASGFMHRLVANRVNATAAKIIAKEGAQMGIRRAKFLAVQQLQNKLASDVGAVVVSTAMYTGSNWAESYERFGEDNPVSALATGLGAGFVSLLLPKGKRAAIERFMGPQAAHTFDVALKNNNKIVLAGIVRDFFNIAGSSAVEEFGQESLALANAIWNDPELEGFAAKTMAYADEIRRPLASGMTVGISGGVPGFSRQMIGKAIGRRIDQAKLTSERQPKIAQVASFGEIGPKTPEFQNEVQSLVADMEAVDSTIEFNSRLAGFNQRIDHLKQLWAKEADAINEAQQQKRVELGILTPVNIQADPVQNVYDVADMEGADVENIQTHMMAMITREESVSDIEFSADFKQRIVEAKTVDELQVLRDEYNIEIENRRKAAESKAAVTPDVKADVIETTDRVEPERKKVDAKTREPSVKRPLMFEGEPMSSDDSESSDLKKTGLADRARDIPYVDVDVVSEVAKKPDAQVVEKPATSAVLETKTLKPTEWRDLAVYSEATETEGKVRVDEDGVLWRWAGGGKRIKVERIGSIETPAKETLVSETTSKKPMKPTKAQEVIERTEKTGRVEPKDLRFGDVVEVTNTSEKTSAEFVYEGVEGGVMQFRPVEDETTLDTVFGTEVVVPENPVFVYDRKKSASAGRVTSGVTIPSSEVREAEAKLQRTAEETAKKLLNINVEHALYDEATNAQKSRLEKIAKKQGKDADKIVDEIEGAILHDDSTIVLARNASEFTTIHEEFHNVCQIVMTVPKYKVAIDAYLNKVYNLYHGKMSKAAKAALGNKFAEQLEAWHADGVMGNEIQEMLSRLVERTASLMVTKTGDVDSKRPSQGVKFMKFIDSIELPEGLRNLIEEMVLVLSKVWSKVLARKADKELYGVETKNQKTKKREAGALPRPTPRIMEMVNELMVTHDAESWLGEDVRKNLQAREKVLRTQFYNAFEKLYKAGKLEHVDKSIRTSDKQRQHTVLGITVEDRLKQMADHSAKIATAMSIGAAIAQARNTRRELAKTLITRTITPEHIQNLADRYAKNFLFSNREGRAISVPDDAKLSTDLAEFFTNIAIPRVVAIIADQLSHEGGQLTSKIIEKASREVSRLLTPAEAAILIGDKNLKRLHALNMMHYRKAKNFSNTIVDWVSNLVDVDYNDPETGVKLDVMTTKYGIPVSTPAFVWGWMVREIGGKDMKGDKAMAFAEAENQKLISQSPAIDEVDRDTWSAQRTASDLDTRMVNALNKAFKNDRKKFDELVEGLKAEEFSETREAIREIVAEDSDYAALDNALKQIQFSGAHPKSKGANEVTLPNMFNKAGLLEKATREKAAVSGLFRQIYGMSESELMRDFGREAVPMESHMDAARKIIGTRKTDYVLEKLIPNEQSVPVKLAMLIVLGGRKRMSMEDTSSLELASEVRNYMLAFMTDIGRGLQLTQWIYNRTREGMLLSINALEHDKRSQPDRVKALEKQVKMLKDHIKKLDAKLKEDVKKNPKEFEKAGRKSVKDKSEHPDIDSGENIDINESIIGKQLKLHLQETLRKSVNKSFGKIAESFGLDMQFSGVQDEGVNIKNVLIEINDMFFRRIKEIASDLNQLGSFVYAEQRSAVVNEFMNRKDVGAVTSGLTAKQHKLLKQGLDGVMLDAREEAMKDIASWYQTLAGKQEDLDAQADEEQQAMNAMQLHVDKFVGLIVEEAKDKESKITEERAEDGLKRCIGALFSVLKERDLVEAGRSSIPLDSAQKINDRLEALIDNRESLTEIWEEAKLLLRDTIDENDMKYIEPKVEAFFSAALGPTTWGREYLRKSLGNFLRFLPGKEFPKAWQASIKNGRTKMLDIARMHYTDAMTEDGSITPESKARGAEMLARKFINEFVVYNEMELSDPKIAESIEVLEIAARQEIENWLDFNAKTFIDVQTEAKALARNIINSTKKTDFKSIGDFNIRQKMAFVLKELGVLPKTKTTQKSAFETFVDARRHIDRVAAIPGIIEELKSELQKAIKDANKSVRENRVTLGATVGLINDLSVTLKAINHSEALNKYVTDMPFTASEIDKLITAGLKVISEHGITPGTMRAFVSNLYQDKDTAIAGLRNAVFEHLKLDDPDSPLAGTAMIGNIASIINDRIGERYEAARKSQLDGLLGYLDRSTADKEDFMDRVIKRIRMGALSDEENITRMAEYMMTPILTDETRSRLEGMVNHIFDRGEIVIEEWRRRSGIADDESSDRALIPGTTEFAHEVDVWYESNERRLLLKDFATEISKLHGFTKMDKLSNIYFSSLLSGVSTQELNMLSTGLQALAHTTARAVAVHLMGSEGGRPGDITGFFNTMSSFFRSFVKGVPEAWRMYRTGDAYGPAMSYYAFTKHPERNPFAGGKMEKFGKVINLVQRGLQSTDFLMAHANAVAFQRSKAHMDALSMGLKGEKLELAEKMFMALRWSSASSIDATTDTGRKELERLVNEFVGTAKYDELVKRMGLLDGYIDQAYFEVTGKELDTNNREAGIQSLSKEQKYLVYSRIDEMQYNSMSPELRADMKKSVGIGTFNIGEGDSDVYDNTWMGKITVSVEHARKKLPQLVFVLPFVRIVGKVYDMSIDYSPWGFRRAQWAKGAMAQQLVDGSQVKINETDIATLQAKAALGSTIITGLFGMAMQSIMAEEDDDDWFQLTGRGDPNRDKTNIMREGRGYGYQEYSVRIGRRWFTYRYTPLTIPLVLIGSMMDTLRYDVGIRSLRKLPANERDAMEMPIMKAACKMFFTGAVNSLPGFLSQNYLMGAANFMEILSTPNDTVREQKAARFFGSLTTGMVIPNFVKQVERSVDPSLYTTPDDMNAYVGAVLRDMPFGIFWKDNVLLKRYNALGEPIRLTSPSALFSLLEITARERENRPHNIGRFVTTGQRSDPTWTWLADKNVSIKTPDSHEVLMGLPMTDDMRQDYIVKRGKIVKNIMDSLVQTEYFKNMSEQEAQKFTSDIVSKVGRLVKTAMIADPGLVRTLIRKNRPEVLRKYGIALPDHRFRGRP